MFENVLVGVDGRSGGRDAIALASHLTDSDGKLTLTHVYSGNLRPSHAISPALVREEREASHKLLEQERASAEVTAELVSIEAMSPGRGIHEQAEQQGCDLLVVGSCSHGALGRAMLGDDTRAALNGAACAVAIAPLGYAEHPTPIARIGVAYNRTPESEGALQLAGELAGATRATVDALEVISIPTYGYAGLLMPASDYGLDEILKKANARLSELPDARGQAVCGLTGEELATFSGQVDLLVVGSRGYGPVKRVMLGSTSNYLERHARCSLLVLPRSANEGSVSGQPVAEEGAHVAS